MERFRNESDRRAWRAYAQSALGGLITATHIPEVATAIPQERHSEVHEAVVSSACDYADRMLIEERKRRGG